MVFTLKTKGIHRLRVHDNRVIFDEPMEFKERIRYGMNHKATGNIFLWTDDGNLYYVKPAQEAWKLVERSKAKYKRALSGGFDQPKHIQVLARCIECHSGASRAAPDLRGIVGRRIAAGGFANYSHALSSKRGVWTRESLTAFLKNPQAFAPGTVMPDPGLSSDEEVDEVLRALVQLAE